MLIGFNCKKLDKYWFCESMEMGDYYDLFLTEIGDHYYIEIGRDKGK